MWFQDIIEDVNAPLPVVGSNKEKVASNGFVFMCDSNQSCRVSVL